MEIITVTPVIKRLFLREFQKSVTRMASAKLEKLPVFGRERIPEIMLAIFLNNISVEDSADHCGLNRSYFGKTFSSQNQAPL